MRSVFVALLALALPFAACDQAGQNAAPAAAPAAPAGPTLEGVWKRVETVIPEGQPNAGTHTTDIQPSLDIFTKSHYSLVFVNGYAARPALSATPTPAEQLAAWQPLAAQAGSYKLEGDKLILTQIVSKDPNAMTGQPNPNPIVIEWAGEDVWFNVTNAAAGTSYKARLSRVAD